MSTLNITLSEELTAFVDRQAAASGYASAGEYLSDLVSRQRDIEQLREKLLEGAESPAEGPLDEAWFEDLRKQVRAHARK